MCTVGPHPPAVRVWHDESPRPGTPLRGAMRDCRCNPLSSTALVTSWHIRLGNKRHVMTSWWTAAADLARYQYLPLNAFERGQLLNTILIPWWTYRTLFLPNDSMFKAMDSLCLRFVLMAEGMELNKVDVHKSYNVRHVTSPHRLGGMGLHQLFWAHRARFTTMVQNMLLPRPESIGCNLSKELPSRAVPIRNYLAILTSWLLAPHFA